MKGDKVTFYSDLRCFEESLVVYIDLRHGSDSKESSPNLCKEKTPVEPSESGYDPSFVHQTKSLPGTFPVVPFGTRGPLSKDRRGRLRTKGQSLTLRPTRDSTRPVVTGSNGGALGVRFPLSTGNAWSKAPPRVGQGSVSSPRCWTTSSRIEPPPLSGPLPRRDEPPRRRGRWAK